MINQLIYYGFDPADPATRIPAMQERVQAFLRLTNCAYISRRYSMSKSWLRRIRRGQITPSIPYLERLNTIADQEQRRGHHGRCYISDSWRHAVTAWVRTTNGSWSALARAVGSTVQGIHGAIVARERKTIAPEVQERIDAMMLAGPCPQRRRPVQDTVDWGLARQMWEGGAYLREIAAACECSYETIRRGLLGLSQKKSEKKGGIYL